VRSFPIRCASSSCVHANSAKLLIGLRRLDRIQILAQQVLDECELDALRVGGLAHDRGNPLEARLTRRTPPPLSAMSWQP
jgi:hypothetical protein